MYISKCRGALVACVCVCLLTYVSAQITFSRDWTGGKRSAPRIAVDCTQFSRVCRHFIHELKQVMSSEINAKTQHRAEPSEDVSPVYDDEK